MITYYAIKLPFDVRSKAKLMVRDEVYLVSYAFLFPVVGLGSPSQVLYFLLLSKKVLVALSLCSRIRLSTPSPVLDLWGFPWGPRRSKLGSMSCWLSCLSGIESLLWADVYMPTEELVSAPIICVVSFLDRILDKKSDTSLLNFLMS
jgi:hypothetical protein